MIVKKYDGYLVIKGEKFKRGIESFEEAFNLSINGFE